jgi:multiple sugar transport system ATP-binding protein
MAGVSLDQITKVYAGGVPAVSALTLDVADGEFLVLVGPSGCGKTTALRMIAGLEAITSGELRIGDRVVNHVPSRDRDIAMVFQSYALYPHLSVYDNIAFGLKLRNTPRPEIERRVRDAARSLDLTDVLSRRPRALSGGQRQRVAMGRAIVRQPAAFLMDEPLSNLDAKLRVQTRAEIARLQRELGTTTVYVTHDQVEALTMGDRVAVMSGGELHQVAPPQTLYDEPINLFVAGFIGSPAMNLLDATLRRSPAGDWTVELGGQTLRLDPELVARRTAIAAYVDQPVIVGIRPEDLEDLALDPAAPTDRQLRSVLQLREALGSEIVAHATVDTANASVALVARIGARSRCREGAALHLSVDTRNLHLFDPTSGLGIYAEQPAHVPHTPAPSGAADDSASQPEGATS